MTIAIEAIVCKGEHLTLTNQRSVFWAKENALVLSDLHIGKSATFRKHGIPISKKVLEDDLDRLQQLIAFFNARKLIIVGDLFHAEYNNDMVYFATWLSKANVAIDLIVGNHDRQSKHFYNTLNLNVYDSEKRNGTIRFIHDIITSDCEDYFTISGHTHPGVLIKGKGRQTIKLPCFQVTDNQLILPAFSAFTGLNTRDLPNNCTCYAFTATSIFKVS